MVNAQSCKIGNVARPARLAGVWLAVLGLCLPAARGQGAPTHGMIRWQNGPTITAQQSAADVAGALSAGARTGQPHVLIQFDRAVSPTERQQLESAGVRLLTYVADNAFFARVEPGRIDAAAAATIGGPRCVLPIQREWKLHRDFLTGAIPSWAIVSRAAEGPPEHGPDGLITAAYVIFHADVDLESEGRRICARHGAEVRSLLRSINAAVIELPAAEVAALADEDSVQWVEPPLPAFAEVNNDNRLRTGADIVQQAPYGLDGTGVTVLVYDGGYGLATHQDFGGRLHVRDSSGLSDHSTHVAGTIGGSGAASSGTWRGMAPGVTLEAYGFEQEGGLQQGFLYTDPGDLEDDYHQAISVYGAAIANNSIGTNTAYNGYPCEWEGDYGATGQLIDTIVRGDGSNPLFAAPFRIVWANGNERNVTRCGTTYHTTAPPACAKNHITVGALNSNDDSVTDFTSWGPTDDDRMKPDLSAPGCQSNDDNGVKSCSNSGGYSVKCGTSMASPTVCGLGALLLQDFRQQYPGEPDFRNSTLKVLLAQTAEDIAEPGPDYKTGYGSVRVQPAVDLLRSGNFTEGVVNHAETAAMIVIVAPTDTQLKVTLAWDDVPGAANAIPLLVNDLDLRVFDSLNNQYYPWTLGGLADPAALAVRTQANHVDNIEQVVIDLPAPGAYRVEVYGYNVPSGPQPFSLAAAPVLVKCSSQGTAALDRALYSCAATATLRVVDCDLNTDDLVAETVDVTISSTSEPAGEVVTLVETTPEAAAFLGTISLSTTDAPGVLLVAPGDTVTLTYNDADDGSGQPAIVTDTALVDCAPPVVSDVQVPVVNPREATITFGTDEPAGATVRYGLACGALTLTKAAIGFRTAHSVILTDLQPDTPYFFAIDVVDEAGNEATDDYGGLCYGFTTPPIPEYFTERFSTNDNDLDNVTLYFEPDGTYDYYAGCTTQITQLPTDPAGGTPLTLANNAYAQVPLAGGGQVSLYGVSYSSVFVGSNGYVTFTAGDADQYESLADHFDTPRVSGLFDDLDPSAGGTVSWQQLLDRFVVTWLNVPEYSSSGGTGSNTFQIELYFDGRIAISYLAVSALDGIVGLSAGLGQPADFSENDLSAMLDCGPRPPVAVSGAVNTAVGAPVTIMLHATDDGLPDPPAALTFTVTGLPAHGALSDLGAGAITAVPYTLVGGGRQVGFDPEPGYWGLDPFTFKANDGGAPPEGGDSNTAVLTVRMGGPEWDPLAYDVNVITPVSTSTDVTLSASDPNADPLTYVVESLPAQGQLLDPGVGPILGVPYTLPGGANVVRYVPPPSQNLVATFGFTAHDASWGSNVATATVTVGGPQRIHFFPLDSDPGWATEGQWAFGQPTGSSFDPTSGYTGDDVYGYNLDGAYTANMPRYYLTTAALDCTTAQNTELRFYRWLGVEGGWYDHAGIEVSNNGTNWVSVWEHSGAALDDRAWVPVTYSIAAVADDQPTVYLRWAMGTTDGTGQRCGWNIDDVAIWGEIPIPTGACCLADGSCTVLSDVDCTGTWLGTGTTCSPNPCPQPPGACCHADGACTFVPEAECGGTWQGAGTACDPNPCPLPWCLGDLDCTGGAPTFDDIKYFAVALSGEAAWRQYYRDRNGGAEPPCPWLLGDFNVPRNGVEFDDIKPFAASIGGACQAYVP